MARASGPAALGFTSRLPRVGCRLVAEHDISHGCCVPSAAPCRFDAARVQSVGDAGKRDDPGCSDALYDRHDVRRENISSKSAAVGTTARSSRLFLTASSNRPAEMSTARLCGREGCFCPSRDRFSFVFGDCRQDVNRKSIRHRHVDSNELSTAFHEVGDEGDIAR